MPISMTTVLGIDPGLRHVGYGIITIANNQPRFGCCGTITPPARASTAARLATIVDQLEQVIISERPSIMAIEKIFYHVSAAVAMNLGQARGVALMLAGRHQMAVVELSARLAKKTITSSGRADKTQMTAMVRLLLPGANPQTEHEADALALALSAWQTQPLGGDR